MSKSTTIRVNGEDRDVFPLEGMHCPACGTKGVYPLGNMYQAGNTGRDFHGFICASCAHLGMAQEGWDDSSTTDHKLLKAIKRAGL